MNMAGWIAIGCLALVIILATIAQMRSNASTKTAATAATSAASRVTSSVDALGKTVGSALSMHLSTLEQSIHDKVDAAALTIRNDIHRINPNPSAPAAAPAPIATVRVSAATAAALSEMAGASAPQFGAPVQQADGMTTISKLDPAAPAASVAVPPPSAAPTVGPSAGSGGTAPAQAQLVVTASDAVLAKHAQLDQVIAAHQAAIVDATAQKATLTAAQDTLNKLVA